MDTEVQEKDAGADELKYPLFPSMRVLLIFFVGIGGGIMLICRYSVNITIICMVDGKSSPSDVTEVLTSPEADVMTSLEANAANRTVAVAKWAGKEPEQKSRETQEAQQGEFQWDKTFQGLLLSSYFYGYTAALAPAGWVADKLPPVLLLMFGIGCQGLCTLAFPVAARTNSYLLLALRALQGLCSSVVLPTATVFVRNWSAPVEYATAFAVCWSIQYLLSGAAYPISSSICQAGGWPLVFYVTGGVALLWIVAAWLLLTSSPDESYICSEDEKRFLASKRLCRIATVQSLSDRNVKREPTPVLAIVTNAQVMIVVGAFFTFCWLFYALNVNLPTFLKETMGVDLAENGSLSGLPTMSMAVGCLAGGKMFQHLITRWQRSRTSARKMVASVSMLIPAGLLGAILLLPPGSKHLTMVLLILCNIISVLGVSGGPMSAGPDIGPQFAGVLWGLSGSIGNLSGVLAPTVAAAMTPNKTLLEWRHFFLIAVVMNIAMDVIILLFWKSEVQPFAKSKDEDARNENTCEA